MSIANNIAVLREKRGWSRPELAKRMSTSPQQVERLEKGMRGLKSEWIEKAARALGVAPADIITPKDGEYALPAIEPSDGDDTVQIQEWDLRYGMGAGGYTDLPVTATPRRISQGLLSHFTRSDASHLYVAQAMGDSMMPTILDADVVLIDTSERDVRFGDKIWAVAYGQIGLIKRLRPMPDGSVKILSDNPSVPPETAYDGEMSVVGRVVAILRKT